MGTIDAAADEQGSRMVDAEVIARCLPALRASSQLTELGDFEYPGMLWAFRWFMVLGGAAAGFAVWVVLEAGWLVKAPSKFNPQVIFATAFLAGLVVASAGDDARLRNAASIKSLEVSTIERQDCDRVP